MLERLNKETGKMERGDPAETLAIEVLRLEKEVEFLSLENRMLRAVGEDLQRQLDLSRAENRSPTK